VNAWRVFAYLEDEDGPALAAAKGMHRDAITPYLSGPEVRATCDGAAGFLRDTSPHDPPGQHCICGVYFSHHRQSRGILAARREVAPAALVWADGEPIPPVRADRFAAGSYRAAGMRLATLWIAQELSAETAAGLASRYGTPVLRWSPRARRRAAP
jgi:hypothetical protein